MWTTLRDFSLLFATSGFFYVHRVLLSYTWDQRLKVSYAQPRQLLIHAFSQEQISIKSAEVFTSLTLFDQEQFVCHIYCNEKYLHVVNMYLIDKFQFIDKTEYVWLLFFGIIVNVLVVTQFVYLIFVVFLLIFCRDCRIQRLLWVWEEGSKFMMSKSSWRILTSCQGKRCCITSAGLQQFEMQWLYRGSYWMKIRIYYCTCINVWMLGGNLEKRERERGKESEKEIFWNKRLSWEEY